MGSSTGCNHKYSSRMLHVWYTYPHLYRENQPNVVIYRYTIHMAYGYGTFCMRKRLEKLSIEFRFKVIGRWKLKFGIIWLKQPVHSATCYDMRWLTINGLTPPKFNSEFPLKSYLPNRKVVFHYPFSGAILNFRWVIVWHPNNGHHGSKKSSILSSHAKRTWLRGCFQYVFWNNICLSPKIRQDSNPPILRNVFFKRFETF